MAGSARKRRCMREEVRDRLAVEGAALVVLGVPPATEFGIDMNSWNTGEKFCGVKMIPPGVHYVYFSSVNVSTRSTSPRTGFFHVFGRGDVLVKRWEAETEDMVDSSVEEVDRVRADLRGLDSRLGEYPYESWPKWISLSNRLTEASLSRLEPLSGKVCSVADLVAEEGQEEEEGGEPRLPAMVARPGTSIRYTALDTR